MDPYTFIEVLASEAAVIYLKKRTKTRGIVM